MVTVFEQASRSHKRGDMDSTQIVSVAVGFFLVLLLLGLVFWRRNLTAAEYTFARIVLALAVACVAVLLSGFLNVTFKGLIEAGGALGVFIVVYRMQPAALQALQGSSAWQDLSTQWRSLRDLNDASGDVNRDDLVAGLNAINKAGRAIGEDDSLLRPFKEDFGKDFCRLYTKLKSRNYPMDWAQTSSAKELELAAARLAERLGCQP
jgi:hypothetical protein